MEAKETGVSLSTLQRSRNLTIKRVGMMQLMGDYMVSSVKVESLDFKRFFHVRLGIQLLHGTQDSIEKNVGWNSR